MRALALRTAGAALEIKKLIANSSTQVHEGARLTDEARAKMDDALDAVRRVTELIAQVDGAVADQLNGISQVNDAVGQIDAITRDNASLVGELADSTQAMLAATTA